MAISNSRILPYKIAALRLHPRRSLRSRGGPLPRIPKTLAMLAGQALACMQKMQEHFSAAMTVI